MVSLQTEILLFVAQDFLCETNREKAEKDQDNKLFSNELFLVILKVQRPGLLVVKEPTTRRDFLVAAGSSGVMSVRLYG